MKLFNGVISISGISFLLFCVFIITMLGYALGRITIKGVNLGTAGVFIVALLFGALFFYKNGDGDLVFFREITERTVAMAKKYGKQSERWLMGYNAQPEDFSQIDKVVDMYESLGVDRFATWTYRGGYGTSVAAKDPIELWDRIGENYKRVLVKE